MIVYGVTLFLSAFLLFLVQPLAGKYILPWFGGSPAVWTTCMLFFQLLLLAGYSYAHILAGRLAPRKQAIVHFLLLLATLLFLPIIPSETWKPAADQSPVLRILGLLTASIGAPYFFLSSTAPLLQAWFSRERPNASPYTLYSLSNLGALLALVSYPFAIEPWLAISRQARLWSWIYASYVLLGAWCAFKIFCVRQAELQDAQQGPSGTSAQAPSIADRLLWLSLAACGSVMLLATTNQLCQDVAVVPLLWVLPLGLYLLSFILCFHSERWYSRLVFGIALAAALVTTCMVLYRGVFLDLRLQIASYSFSLFVCCMVCHGELVRLKPGPRHLTVFYLMIAGGGALGGFFATSVAPRIFRGFWEYHLALGATALLMLVVLFRDSTSPLRRGRPLWAWTLLYCGFLALIATLGIHIHQAGESSLEMTRNFFGVLRVLELDKDIPDEHRYTLMHGRIEHGFQLVDAEKRFWPTSYFGSDSGVGLAILHHPKRLALRADVGRLRIGVVGLGTGTIATYGEPGDYVRFYEINSEVLRLSDKFFSYKNDSRARVEVVLGDARVSMEREKERGEHQDFDVLAIDAFSSDAIPVHLLTRECFQLYWHHLKEDGILAVHISSRYFDLSPVVRGFAASETKQGLQALYVSAKGSVTQETDSSDWVLLTSNQRFLESRSVKQAVKPWPEDSLPPQPWTDDYTNLFRLFQP